MARIRKRSTLHKWKGKCITVCGIFQAWSQRSHSFLVFEVTHAGTGELLCDHVWVQMSGKVSHPARPGDLVKFRARVHEYDRGRALGLTKPTRFKVLGKMEYDSC